MSENNSLADLALTLCEQRTEAGTSFEASVVAVDSGETIVVKTSICPDFPLVVTKTSKQILSVIDLFSMTDVRPESVAELDRILLALSPIMPLSSFGTIGDEVVLFGSMPVATITANIVHELEVQSQNCIEALEVLEELLINDSDIQESV